MVNGESLTSMFHVKQFFSTQSKHPHSHTNPFFLFSFSLNCSREPQNPEQRQSGAIWMQCCLCPIQRGCDVPVSACCSCSNTFFLSLPHLLPPFNPIIIPPPPPSLNLHSVFSQEVSANSQCP